MKAKVEAKAMEAKTSTAENSKVFIKTNLPTHYKKNTWEKAENEARNA
jgi:hypothetical protein